MKDDWRLFILSLVIGTVVMTLLGIYTNAKASEDQIIENPNEEAIYQLSQELMDNPQTVSNESNKTILTLYTASWCQWCHKELSVLKGLGKYLKDRNIVLVVTDVSSSNMSLPTLKYKSKTHTGFMTEQQLKDWLI